MDVRALMYAMVRELGSVILRVLRRVGLAGVLAALLLPTFRTLIRHF